MREKMSFTVCLCVFFSVLRNTAKKKGHYFIKWKLQNISLMIKHPSNYCCSHNFPEIHSLPLESHSSSVILSGSIQQPPAFFTVPAKSCFYLWSWETATGPLYNMDGSTTRSVIQQHCNVIIALIQMTIRVLIRDRNSTKKWWQLCDVILCDKMFMWFSDEPLTTLVLIQIQ